MIPKYRAFLKQYNVMVDDVSDMTFKEGNLEFIGRRTVGGVSLQYCADSIELMQSTGLHDKNGKEIFEGDIITTNAYGCIVNFGEYTYLEDEDTQTTEVGFYLSFLNVTPATYVPFDNYYWENCEVIGNIHENKLDLIMYELHKYNKTTSEEVE